MTPLERLQERMDGLAGARRHSAPAAAIAPPAPPVERLLLSPAQAAEAIGVTARTLRTWGVPYVRIGRTVGYRRADLAAFVAAHVVQSDPKEVAHG